MKTAISIPNQIFKEAERLARHLGKTRSELYREAVSEYVARHDWDKVTEAMNKVAKEVDTRPDKLVSRIASDALKRIEW